MRASGLATSHIQRQRPFGEPRSWVLMWICMQDHPRVWLNPILTILLAEK